MCSLLRNRFISAVDSHTHTAHKGSWLCFNPSVQVLGLKTGTVAVMLAGDDLLLLGAWDGTRLTGLRYLSCDRLGSVRSLVCVGGWLHRGCGFLGSFFSSRHNTSSSFAVAVSPSGTASWLSCFSCFLSWPTDLSACLPQKFVSSSDGMGEVGK